MAKKKPKKNLWPWQREPPFIPGDGVYCDGGLASRNPSSVGGSWAHCTVKDGEMICWSSGVITPEEAGLPTITNNLAELLAAVRALQECPDRWDGFLYTDSQVTYLRIAKTKRQAKLNGVPQWLQEQLFEAKERLGGYQVRLLAGHPEDRHLKVGVNDRGFSVSKHNVWCDLRCGLEISQRFGIDQ